MHVYLYLSFILCNKHPNIFQIFYNIKWEVSYDTCWLLTPRKRSDDAPTRNKRNFRAQTSLFYSWSNLKYLGRYNSTVYEYREIFKRLTHECTQNSQNPSKFQQKYCKHLDGQWFIKKKLCLRLNSEVVIRYVFYVVSLNRGRY